MYKCTKYNLIKCPICEFLRLFGKFVAEKVAGVMPRIYAHPCCIAREIMLHLRNVTI